MSNEVLPGLAGLAVDLGVLMTPPTEEALGDREREAADQPLLPARLMLESASGARTAEP